MSKRDGLKGEYFTTDIGLESGDEAAQIELRW
jgi:hypothetical protein